MSNLKISNKNAITSLSSHSPTSNPLSNLFKNHVNSSLKTEHSFSSYRHVFQTSQELKEQFANFLNTIFYQLDEKKVFALMNDILQDETKTDEAIYQELSQKIDLAKKPLSFFSMLKALHVVQNGMGKQVSHQIGTFSKPAFQNYVEIYNRRYCNPIEKNAGLSFQKTAAICDQLAIGFKDRIEAGSIVYPYQTLIPLNDPSCKDPALEVSKTYRPLGDEIEPESVDLISCLGGLHHVPEDRLEPFIQSMSNKLKPGAVCLLREHDASQEDVRAIASVVHSFVNAVDKLPWEKESAEIRNFQPESYWVTLMEKHGFSRIDKSSLILQDDPTRNAMTAFVKKPKTAQEVETAASYLKDFIRSNIGSYAGWIEWGNVRFSKQYAEFIQDHHSYAFDSIGHVLQHWTHLYYTIKKSLSEPDRKLNEVFLSDNTAMNLFIVLGTSAQLGFAALTNLPAICLAKWRHGDKWREVTNLSTVERFEAEFQKDYSASIDYVPFFKYPYFKTIQSLWETTLTSKEPIVTKLQNTLGAISLTLPLGVQGLFSHFINSVYYDPNDSSDAVAVHVLIDDPLDELDSVIEKWEKAKLNTVYQNQKPYENCVMKLIYSAEGKKLVSLPFYKPFTEIAKLFSQSKAIQFQKIAGNEKVTLDLLLTDHEATPLFPGAELVYEMKRLQDPEKKRYATFEVEVDRLCSFCRDPKVEGHLEYIHAHR